MKQLVNELRSTIAMDASPHTSARASFSICPYFLCLSSNVFDDWALPIHFASSDIMQHMLQHLKRPLQALLANKDCYE